MVGMVYTDLWGIYMNLYGFIWIYMDLPHDSLWCFFKRGNRKWWEVLNELLLVDVPTMFDTVSFKQQRCGE